MKLNTKKTIFVGFAFLIICMFWQVYDTVIARVLVNSFGLNQTWSGVVLAIDNILALFLIPLFGVISDKTSTKFGRRTPFIAIGTVVAAIIFIFVGIFTTMQDTKIAQANIQPVYTCTVYYNNGSDVVDYKGNAVDDSILTQDNLNKKYVIVDNNGIQAIAEAENKEMSISKFFNSIFSRTETETELITVNYREGKEVKVYTFETNNTVKVYASKELASDARSLLAQDVRNANVGYFIGFMVILCFVLVAMGAYRSPAVALMPDVTPKPLRSKANAVINLMGSVGGVIALGFLTFTDSDYGNHMLTFALLSTLMIGFLVAFLVLVKEPLLVKERIETEKEYGICDEDAESAEDEAKKANDATAERMPRDVKKSFILILFSIVFWFFAYNAATSKFSVYATNILDTGYSLALIVAQAAAIICYIPIGIISSKIGRKKTILIGICILFAAFLLGSFLTAETAILTYVVMALAGIGWATINVNSFPMVVEMCKGADVGRYTGYYYTASMAAQIATPILSGMLMDAIGMRTLFPYCCVFCVCALVTMMLVKHGDSKPVEKKSKLEMLDVDDD